MVEANPDWAAFDIQGRRTESAAASSRDSFKGISKCAFQSDGTKVCDDNAGQGHESRTQERPLSDGTRELSYFYDSKMVNRQVTLLDEQRRAVAFHNYDGSGRLTSEEATQFSSDSETRNFRVYDEGGQAALNERTQESEDKTRFDRWSYDSKGDLVWHLALDGNGDLLSYWYKVGYKPKQSSSGSLGICRPRLCVSYKFDEEGSGRMEKLVQHTSGEGNLEPDSEEDYSLDGFLDEKVEMKYARDSHGNWTSRSVFVWAAASNQMIEIERDSRTIDYY